MPFAQGLTTEQVGEEERGGCDNGDGEVIVTGTAAAIVTALGLGPQSALDLSQSLNVTHANARQTLRRLAASGVVTRLRRGLYALPGCDSVATEAPIDEPEFVVLDTPRPVRVEQRISDQALAEVLADFEAMNDPLRPEAWA